MTQQKRSGQRTQHASLFARFFGDKRGAFAIQFALMLVPLVTCTGLAIDGGRSFLARYELQSALDAAALAVGSTTGDDAALSALARKYVDTNFKSADTTQAVLTLTSTSELVTLRGTSNLTTYFMPLMGISEVTISADAEVRRGGANVEVSLILDVTGSMGSPTSPGSRMYSLIQASNTLIDTVVGDTQTPWFSKIAVVPWAANVYVGSYADVLRGPANGTVITDATWKADIETISAITWKDGAALTVSAATWKNGAARAASTIQKVGSQTMVTSSGHGFSDGDFVYLTNADGGFASLNSTVFKVAAAATNTFKLQTTTGIDINLTGTPASATTGTLQKCYNAACEFMITTSGSHGLALGNTVYLSGILSGIDSTATATTTTAITISALGPTTPLTTFMVPGSSPAIAGAYSGSGGRVQKCFTTTCQFQVQTSGSHTFTAGDRVFISDVVWSPTTGAPPINTTAGSSIAVPFTTANAFLFPTLIGPYYSNIYTTASGRANTCFSSICEIQVTSASHGLAANDRAFITGVVGMTGSPTINNIDSSRGTQTSWVATSVTPDRFLLSGSIGPNYTGWTSGGVVWCLKQGCQYYRFTAADGSTQIRQISQCVTERTGTQANTDAAPATANLADDYPIGGNICPSANTILPLTANKTTLHTKINALTSGGSTAGQLGVGWGWYMLSPNFASIWPASENRALDYGTPLLRKVMVLMTDGDFNIAHCNGVVSNNYSGGAAANARINCNAENGSPYTNAQSLCTNMKAAGITIYTVGFQVASRSAPDNFLRSCASSTSYYFLATTNSEFRTAFAQIATNISRLRISR
jgi:Flp pilus assembly protein TadG